LPTDADHVLRVTSPVDAFAVGTRLVGFVCADGTGIVLVNGNRHRLPAGCFAVVDLRIDVRDDAPTPRAEEYQEAG
jgi:hypothetical protein